MRTSAQRSVVRATIAATIDQWWAEHWTSPTVRNIATATGLDVATTHAYLQRMVSDGDLQRHQPSPGRVLYRTPPAT